MITDEQIASLQDTTGDSLSMIGDFLNSSSLWELLGTMIGVVLCVAIICAVALKIYSWIGFYTK